MKPLFVAVGLGVFAWTLWALRRTKLLWAAVPIGLPLIVTLTDPACYYYSAFIVAAVLAQQRPQLGPVMLAVGGASQLLGSMAKPPKYQGFYWIDDLYAAQAWLFFFFGILILYIYSRPCSLARLRAWWQGEPEPARRAGDPGSVVWRSGGSTGMNGIGAFRAAKGPSSTMSSAPVCSAKTSVFAASCCRRDHRLCTSRRPITFNSRFRQKRVFTSSRPRKGSRLEFSPWFSLPFHRLLLVLFWPLFLYRGIVGWCAVRSR